MSSDCTQNGEQIGCGVLAVEFLKVCRNFADMTQRRGVVRSGP
jgi:hypothetical protein